MSHTATIMIAPILDEERYRKPEWERPGRHLYRPSSLTLLPSKEPRPLLVNHDKGRRIGTVENLWRLGWPGGAWIVASCNVPEPPAWLKRDTPASFGRFDVHTTEPGEIPEVVTSAFVSEVSVLLGEEPAEPLAKVLSLRPTEEPKRTATKSPAAGGSSDRAVVGDVYDERPREWDELERIVGYQIDEWNFEQALTHVRRRPLQVAYEEHMEAKRQLEPGVIIRPGVGQVLGVR